MTGTVRRPSVRPRHDRGGGAGTLRIIAPDTGARALLNGFTVIPPSGGIPVHHHNVEDSVLIVEGRATVEARDMVWGPAEAPHRLRNPSDDEALRIFWTYVSAEATRTLVATGETRPVVSPRGAG